MHPFDLKAALPSKQTQNPVINPHTHGVMQGSNVWLTNFKLPHLSCVREVAPSPSCQRFVSFLQQQGISHAVLQSGDMHAEVPAFLQTTI